MPTIEIGQETLRRLQEHAEPLVDTADTVIVRLIEHFEATAGHQADGVRTQHADRRRIRAPKGAKTPTGEFHDAIIDVLSDAGGELPTRDVIDEVGRRMDDHLNDLDHEPLKSGEIRWRNTVRWARTELVEQGVLDGDAPHGRWRLQEDEDPEKSE